MWREVSSGCWFISFSFSGAQGQLRARPWYVWNVMRVHLSILIMVQSTHIRLMIWMTWLAFYQSWISMRKKWCWKMEKPRKTWKKGTICGSSCKSGPNIDRNKSKANHICGHLRAIRKEGQRMVKRKINKDLPTWLKCQNVSVYNRVPSHKLLIIHLRLWLFTQGSIHRAKINKVKRRWITASEKLIISCGRCTVCWSAFPCNCGKAFKNP